MLCASDQRYCCRHFLGVPSDRIDRLLSDFKETLKQWRDWDSITSIQNHQLIRDYLVDRFRLDLQVRLYRYHVTSHLTDKSSGALILRILRASSENCSRSMSLDCVPIW